MCVVNNEVTSMLILPLPEPLAKPSPFSLIWDSYIWNQFNMQWWSWTFRPTWVTAKYKFITGVLVLIKVNKILLPHLNERKMRSFRWSDKRTKSERNYLLGKSPTVHQNNKCQEICTYMGLKEINNKESKHQT